jgi:hypothetical protein
MIVILRARRNAGLNAGDKSGLRWRDQPFIAADRRRDQNPMSRMGAL